MAINAESQDSHDLNPYAFHAPRYSIVSFPDATEADAPVGSVYKDAVLPPHIPLIYAVIGDHDVVRNELFKVAYYFEEHSVVIGAMHDLKRRRRPARTDGYNEYPLQPFPGNYPTLNRMQRAIHKNLEDRQFRVENERYILVRASRGIEPKYVTDQIGIDNRALRVNSISMIERSHQAATVLCHAALDQAIGE